jgi:hypothetical protein
MADNHAIAALQEELASLTDAVKDLAPDREFEIRKTALLASAAVNAKSSSDTVIAWAHGFEAYLRGESK